MIVVDLDHRFRVVLAPTCIVTCVVAPGGKLVLVPSAELSRLGGGTPGRETYGYGATPDDARANARFLFVRVYGIRVPPGVQVRETVQRAVTATPDAIVYETVSV